MLIMLINNKNISEFNAKLLSRSISNADFNITNEWLNNSINPLISKNYHYKYKKLKFSLDIKCNSASELEAMKSNLFKELAISTIKFSDINYYYNGFVTSISEPSFITEVFETIIFEMLVIAEGKEIIKNMKLGDTTCTFNVDGNQVTPAIVEIIPNVSLIDLTLEGLSEDPIILKNLKMNEVFILDGVKGKVTCNGANRLNDTDFWEFPKLKPGQNTMKINKANCTINVKYKPRYV